MRLKLPQYDNGEINRIINDRIHNDEDRAMFREKLINGKSLMAISNKQNRPYSTVRDHYYSGIKIIFSDFPDPW